MGDRCGEWVAGSPTGIVSAEVGGVATVASALVDPDAFEAAWVAGVAEMAASSQLETASTEVAGVGTDA